jgi:hypothetical protein
LSAWISEIGKPAIGILNSRAPKPNANRRGAPSADNPDSRSRGEATAHLPAKTNGTRPVCNPAHPSPSWLQKPSEKELKMKREQRRNAAVPRG